MNFILEDNIVYEDDNLLIVNKPRGLLLQQDGDNSHESLDKIVGDYLKMVAMPVHRLDKDTSGLCVFAKNKKTSQASERVGGYGGGHNVAAGATIPEDKKEEFLDIVEDMVRSQLT